MMWGAISYDRKTQLMHITGNLSAARYRDEVLTPHSLPAMNLRRGILQHDNARPHTARATVDFNVIIFDILMNFSLNTQCAKCQCNVMIISVFKMMWKI